MLAVRQAHIIPGVVEKQEQAFGADMPLQSNLFHDHGDASLLWQPATNVTIDEASYDPYPPEGVILQRVGSKLVAPARVEVVATARLRQGEEENLSPFFCVLADFALHHINSAKGRSRATNWVSP